MATATRDHWNAARYAPGASGHYESWFQRANDATGQRAFWIRYTIFAPRDRPDAAVGELWAIAFDRAGPHIVAVKQVHPITACSFSRERLDVAIGAAHLDDTALRGTAASHGHTIAWDLRYAGGQPPLLLLPERLYAASIPRAKALVGRPLARFTGSLTVDGETLVIADWVGSQNHNWGARHTDRYAWGQVAGFDDHPDAFLECSTARLKLGPLWTPPMSPVLLRLGDHTLAWNGLLRALRARGRYAPYDWQIDTSGPDGALAIHITAGAADFVALRYDNPPGGSKICLNSKIARCEVTLRRAGTTTVLRSSRAAFEILDDTAPPGVQPAA
ncbi:MAG: hypothetical protein E6J90_48940 [Deltaproteobacteria bacterium]|nr:MAG: hypothetical protein E6J90_48940 [Deltaproteobacteria bacterium]